MNQYYLILNQENHYKLQAAKPDNNKQIILIIQLSPQQKTGFDTLINERNDSIELLKISAEYRDVQKEFNSLFRERIDKAISQNSNGLEWSKEQETKKDKLASKQIDLENKFDQKLQIFEKNFGRLLTLNNEIPLF